MMDSKALEVECPVCDHMVSVDAVRCPACNAVFSLSGVEELQRVAREINDPATADKPSADDGAPRTEASGEGAGVIANGPPKEKGGLLGKLFRKKK